MKKLYRITGGVVATDGENMAEIAASLNNKRISPEHNLSQVQKFRVRSVRTDELDFEIIVFADTWGEAQRTGKSAVIEALKAAGATLVEDDGEELDHSSHQRYVESLGTKLSYA